MRDLDRENAINEAVALLTCLQDFVVNGRDEVQVNANGLYTLLACVIARLKAV